jgi:LCP family protein required for cell wall assembly
MRWLTVILVFVVSSCLGLFTSYATVDMLPGHVKTINPKPEDNIVGIDDSEDSEGIVDGITKTGKVKNETASPENPGENAEDADAPQANERPYKNPNDANDTFNEQTEEAKPYKLFLIMATDVVYNGSGKRTRSLQGRTDSIMIAKLSEDSIDLLSIPRDSRVYIPGFGFDKINAANVYGGPELLLKTLEKWLNVHIEDYALINTFGVVQFVDLFGGIYFNVPKRMHYIDHTAKLNIDLYPGYQHLDGIKVHNLLRFRHDGMGDLNRVARQQQFIRVMLPKVLSPLNFLKVPSAIGIINDNVKTNLSTRKILYLANKAIHINDLKDKITMHTLPGTGGMYRGGWYWLVDEKKAHKMLEDLALVPGNGTEAAAAVPVSKSLDNTLSSNTGTVQ